MNTFRILVLFGVVSLAGLGKVVAQTFDIASGGLPTMTGALGGSVTGSSSTTTNLNVTINWGEISPANTNGRVVVTVPVAIRSIAAYQINVVTTGGTNVNPQGLQRTDIGFGLNRSFTSMGANAFGGCTSTSDVFNAAITADPTVGVTLNAAGRTTYVSSLNNTSTLTDVLHGPRLSVTSAGAGRGRTDNGWIIKFVFCVTPQFYATGVTTTTVTISIGAGPGPDCP